MSPFKQQQQHETISIRAATPTPAASCGTTAAAAAGAVAVDEQASLQLPSFLMPQLTEDEAAAAAAHDNPLFANPLVAAVARLPASSLWGKDTAESSCAVSGGGLKPALLPASLQEQASSITSIPHMPMLPVDEGTAAQAEGEAAGGNSSSSSKRCSQRPDTSDGQKCKQQQQQQQQHRGEKAAHRSGRSNSPRISASGSSSSSVVLSRSKSQANARNRKGAAGMAAAAVTAAAVARPGLLLDGLPEGLQPMISNAICADNSSSSINAAAAGISGSGLAGVEPSVEGGPGSWLWLRTPQAAGALSDIVQLGHTAKP
jgi:hypothetical protein